MVECLLPKQKVGGSIPLRRSRIMLNKYYPINSSQHLNSFFKVYFPTVVNQLSLFGIDAKKFALECDHMGLQVLSSKEFDEVHTKMTKFAKLVHGGKIHSRRNNVYVLGDKPTASGFELQSIEIFEPKPNADLQHLKPGFEHTAFKTNVFGLLEKYFESTNLPIAKRVEDDRSIFFKTKLVNMIEIEFRTDFLWKDVELN